MNEFEAIDDAIYNIADGNIVRKRKNPVIPILFTLAGAALTVWSLNGAGFENNANLSSSLMLVGFATMLVGVIRLLVVLRGVVPMYKPTGEKLHRYEMSYDAKNKWTVCNAVEAGDTEALGKVAKSDSSSVLVTVYTTTSGSFAAVQAAEYVPHQFVPITGIVQLAQENCKTLIAMV